MCNLGCVCSTVLRVYTDVFDFNRVIDLRGWEINFGPGSLPDSIDLNTGDSVEAVLGSDNTYTHSLGGK